MSKIQDSLPGGLMCVFISSFLKARPGLWKVISCDQGCRESWPGGQLAALALFPKVAAANPSNYSSSLPVLPISPYVTCRN